MGLKTDHQFMIDSLSALLENGEKLYCPFYGCSMEQSVFLRSVWNNRFGFFGRTDSNILVVILNPFIGRRIDWTDRIPLKIKKVKVRQTLFLRHYMIKIYFDNGNVCVLRAATKVLIGDFVNQKENVESFVRYLLDYTV